MAGKSIDSEVLAALHVMSKNKTEGVRYIEFVNQGIMSGALSLIDKGYAAKIRVGEDDAYYCLTQKGVECLDKIVKFTQEQF